MDKQKSKKAFLISIISVALFFVFVFGFTITYAFFGGSVRVDMPNIVLANIDVDVSYTLNFGDVILPNTIYDGTGYTMSIKNTGNSGPIYIKVKVDNPHKDYMKIMLASESLWALGGANNDEYYYLSTLNLNSNQSFLAGIETNNNFNNSIAGDELSIKFTVYAIQSQYGAVKEDSSWWANAPEAFKTLVS